MLRCSVQYTVQVQWDTAEDVTHGVGVAQHLFRHYCTLYNVHQSQIFHYELEKSKLGKFGSGSGSATLVNDLIIFVLYLLFHSSVDTRGPPTVTARLSAKVTIAVIVVVVFRVSL